MGLATIDPHSVKVRTEFHKIPKFGVNRPNNKQDTANLKYQNFTKKCMNCRTLLVRHFFVNFDSFNWLYLAYYWVYLHQTWGFCETWCALSHYVDQ